MISELKDDEILEFLMTSDFEQEYKPEELKYLLIKWRYFYRLLYGKFELLKVDSEHDKSKLKEDISRIEKTLEKILIENVELKESNENLKNRKLTFKERLTGKIITRDENK